MPNDSAADLPRRGDLPTPPASSATLIPKELLRQAWHAVDGSDVLKAFRSDASGLSGAEAANRAGIFGPNRLKEAAARSPVMRFLSQFHNLLIYVLIGAAATSLFLGHRTDAAVILAVVLLNAVIGFIQEGRAERSLDAIRRMIDPLASVLRDGHRKTIRAEEITPGDVVLLEAGDRVPADLRLLTMRGLRIDEAALTGESAVADKGTSAVPTASSLGDRTSMAYSGTIVAAGRGVGVVVGIGELTELGRIGTLITSIEVAGTRFIKRVDALTRGLTAAILGIAFVTFVIAVMFRNYEAPDAFMTMVGLAVAAIPEGLPAALTITLAIGVRRMAARKAIIRKLSAVETLGSVSVICSDKTGTLTRNEMTARIVVTPDGTFAATGGGYSPVGTLTRDGEPVEAKSFPPLLELIETSILCNDAALHQAEDQWHVDGDPMEGALVALALKAQLQPDLLRRQVPRKDEIPFDAEHRFMATLHHDHEGQSFIVAKGAPERILAMCSSQRNLEGDRPLDNAFWLQRTNALASEGYRVLAFASRPAEPGKQDLVFSDLNAGATFLGVIGFIDPPREEAIEAISECKQAGIRVFMITGDHAETASAIARQLGLSDDPAVMTGSQIDALDEAGLRRAVGQTMVFARTSPEHKLRLVEAFQTEGLVVAMTGDGVNDAPALKRADIGIAMGQKGTAAARDAAKMVLLDDNFASIVAAVREGRTVYDNLIKVIALTLPTNGGEAFTILAAVAFGLALPITAVQILWVNLITAVALDLALAFEPTEPGTMQRRPRPSSEGILSPYLVWRIVFVSALMVFAAFGIFFWATNRGLPVETAQTMVVNTIVVMEVFYLFSLRFTHTSSLTFRGVLGTPAVLIGLGTVVTGQLALTYAPFMQAAFGTRAVGFTEATMIFASGVGLLFVLEIEKRIAAVLFR